MTLQDKPQSLLTFRVGPVFCCAPSLPVRSIISPPKLTQLPGSEPSHPGIFKHGSHLVKVLDLRQKFGVDKTQQTQPGNFIITFFETENCAFWVDQILDVFDFPSAGWGNLPAAIPRGIFSRTLLLNEKIHLYVEFENLASLNNLGYLRQYIQQLKKQQDTQIIDKPQKNISSPVKPTESKINIKQENKNTKIDKHEKVKQPPVTTQRKQSVIQPAVTSKHKSEMPLTAVNKKTQQNKPIRESEAAITTNSSFTQTSFNHNKKPVITHKTSTPNTSATGHDDAKNTSSASPIILIIILILISLAAVFYYLFMDSMDSIPKLSKKNTTAITSQQLEYKFKDVKNSNEQKLDITPSIQEESNIEKNLTKIKIENLNIEDQKSNVVTEQKQEDTLQSKEHSILNNKEDITYQADITRQDSDITITLHEDAAGNILQQGITLELQQKNKVSKTESIDNSIQESTPQPVSKEKVSREIIHIIVKGDTLWAIAKKYVQDPFLYPELARLSKIENPHRIYPGNRVRIRFIKN